MRLALASFRRVEVRHAGHSYWEMVEGGKALEYGRGLAPPAGQCSRLNGEAARRSQQLAAA